MPHFNRFTAPRPKPPSRKPTGLEEEIAESAALFAEWLRKSGASDTRPGPGAVHQVESALERFRQETPLEESRREQILSDAAAFLGESIREAHGGAWKEDPVFGVVLQSPGGIPNALARPLAMAGKKWELGNELSLARFFETLPGRLEQERRFAGLSQGRTDGLDELARQLADCHEPRETLAQARELASRFQETWKARFGVPPSLTLQGVRETERFLRSQFFLFTAGVESLLLAGFFVGEVARGLFQGEWTFEEVRANGDPWRAALRWPELCYYPAGRVMKLVVEQPEAEAFDEYIRLVPSARSELRKQARDRRRA